MSSPNPSEPSASIQQGIDGDQNQVISQVSGGVVINHLTIHDRVPAAVVPPMVSPLPALTQADYRQRQVLLNKVKDYWIKGVLEASLHTQALIELGWQEQRDGVQHPFNQMVAETTAVSLPAGTDATAVFEQMGAGRTLLILGEPGSGKTITLLKLAQDLIARTKADLRQPIPVVFNLASWGRKSQPIAPWLVQELQEKYQVSKTLGTTWVNTESLILLLDGLDEVPAEQRPACVYALNQFMQTHGTTELVVCCRSREYQALPERLILRRALCIQPLTPEQLDQYIDQAGHRLSALKTVLHQDTDLQDLATSPLILSIMSLAYQDCTLDQVIQSGAAGEYRQRLLQTYVDRMGQRHRYDRRYTPSQTQRWLTWLAKIMTQNAQSVFLIEWIQPDWLCTRSHHLEYRMGVALLVGLLGGCGFGLINEIIPGLVTQGFTAAMIPHVRNGLLQMLVFTPIVGIIPLFVRAEVILVETLKWSWQRALRQSALWVGLGCTIGLLGGALEGFVFNVALQPASTWLHQLSTVRVYLYDGVLGAIAGLMYGLTQGMVGSEIEAKTIPNQAVWRSALNTVLFSILGGVVGSLTGIGVAVLMDSVETMQGLRDGMTIGWLSGFLGGGGIACVKHLVLRLLFCHLGYSPWNYVRFLDYATDHLFLQKVGGGYIFVHRMILEHFAEMPLDQD